MKRIIIILAFFILTLPVYSQGLPVPRVPTVGVLPFTAEGVSDAEAAEATRLIIAEISSWGVMTVLSGNDANNGEYIIQGNISREDDQIVIRASTTLRSTGRVITESRERAATLAGIPIFTFCVEVTENIPFPNFLIGRWQSTVEMAGGPVSTILEFRADRTVNVLRYDTWERDGTDSLLYQAIGAGTYSYFLNLRRTAIIDGRQIQTDATAGVRLILEDALPYYSYLSEDGLRLLFNEARTSFEIVAGGLPFGDDRGPGDDSSRRVYYTTFTQVPITPAIAHFPAED
ncbi:MAG: hypothetical protein FWG77_10880, partial [Treponema sp.]|nr:hypothetical protein [Treponema sp.]